MKGRIKAEKPFTEMYNELKDEFKLGQYLYDPGKLEYIDTCSRRMIDYLGDLTMNGERVVENLPIDTWKFRVWNIVERAGLLPEYVDESEIEEDQDY